MCACAWTRRFLAGFVVSAVIAGISIFGAVPLAFGQSAHFSVSPDDPADYIWLREFSPNTAVTVSLDDPDTGGVNPDYVYTPTTDESGNFDLGPVADFSVGWQVTVDDGVTAKTHTVLSVGFDGFDVDADTCWGFASPDSSVNVGFWDDDLGQWINRFVTTDNLGYWYVDFSYPVGDETGPNQAGNLKITTTAVVSEADADGDATQTNGSPDNPMLVVFPEEDRIDGWRWEPFASVDITIDRPGFGSDIDWFTTVQADSEGNLQVFSAGEFDIVAGDVLSATDGILGTDTTVTNLQITGVDVDTDLVSGTAEPFSWVWVNSSSGGQAQVQADSGGNWTADPGSDITPGTHLEAYQQDDDWDRTQLNYYVSNPRFGADSVEDCVRGWDWPGGTTIFVLVDGELADTATTDGGGNFNSYVSPGYDIVEGSVVSVTDGLTLKSTTVTALTVTGVDAAADVVSGTAAPYTYVHVWVHGDPNFHRMVQAADDGNWSADFSVPDGDEAATDIVPGSQGEANQEDPDGDLTQILWRVANPNFGVAPDSDEVFGGDWIRDGAVTISVDDPGSGPGTDFETTTSTDSSGNFGTSFQGEFDLLPGQLVSVTDGTGTKATTITGITVTNVDPDADTVSGTADPFAWVWASIWDGNGTSRQVQADEFGDWTADFSVAVGDEQWQQVGEIDLGTQGEASQHDEDNDFTTARWRVPNPSFGVDPGREEIWGSELAPNSSVTITMDDPGTPDPVDFEMTADTDEWGNFGTGFYGQFDSQVGFVVTVTDGSITKEHTILPLVITSVDPDTDTVAGTADPYAWIEVDAYGMASRQVQADEYGDWVADFATGEEWEGTADITKGTELEARWRDDDNDYTRAWARVPNPSFGVDPDREEIWGMDLAPNSSVTITVDDPGTPDPVDFEMTADTDDWGNFGTGFYGQFDSQVGFVVTVTDGSITKEHTILPLVITSVDPDTDTVAGTADPYAWIEVDVYGMASRQVQADEYGDWVADFATAEEWETTADIGKGTELEARWRDDDSDYTRAWARVPNPSFAVEPRTDSVWGNDFGASAELTITVDDPGTPAPVDFETTTWTDEWGGFGIGVGDEFDLRPGHEVTVTDGSITKTHEVLFVEVTGVDVDLDTVSGIAEPYSSVWVSVYDNGAGKEVQADEFGDWTADFSTGQDWERADIGPGSGGSAQRFDEDSDYTQDSWYVPNPVMSVRPIDNGIGFYDWPAGEQVTIEIDDPATPASPDYTRQETANEWNNIELWIDQAEFDIQAGQMVTATCGDIVKTHTVTSLTVDSLDPDTDTITGTADPYTEVVLNKWYEWDGSVVVYADEYGDWTAHAPLTLNDDGNAVQYDEDGDCTEIYWHVPNPMFRVSPMFDEVSGNDWPAYAEMTVTWDDPATPASPDVTTSTVCTDRGEFWVYLGGDGIDVRAGDIVTVTDGEVYKEHVVTPVQVREVDAALDTVSGTAEPDSMLWVSIDDPDYQGEGSGRKVQADGDGNWTADFADESGTPYDIVADVTSGNVVQGDEDADETWIAWSARNPRLTAAPTADFVGGDGWPADAPVTVSVDDPDTGPGVDWSQGAIEIGPWWGDFSAETVGYDLQPGDVVTVTNGTSTKIHTVTALMVGGVDVGNDVIYGTSDSTDPVQVHWFVGDEQGALYADMDPGGDWIADLPLNDVPIDLYFGDYGGAEQFDEDNDSTWVDWKIVTPAPADDYATTVQDAQIAEDAPGLLGNDEYNPGETSIETVTAPAHGDLALDVLTGAWTYTPDAGWSGDDSFEYVLVQSGFTSDPATVHITVTPTNAAPVAEDDSFDATEDTQLVVGAPGVLGNDTDDDGDDLTAAKLTNPAHGTVTVGANGSFTYTPAANFNGTDSFTYKANDGQDDSNVATVEIVVAAVNDAPTAVADSASVDQDGVLTIAAPGVLANDSDIEGSPLTASLVTDAAYGELALAANGGYTYTPDAGWSGTDTFTYRAHDGAAYSAPVAVTITVTPAEFTEVPIEGDDRFETAVAVSQAAFPDGADWVIIATGRNWPDALGGSALAGALDGPILLTDTTTMSSGVVDEIDRLGATKAIILGGTAAVAPQVETALNTMLGDANVERIAGADRYLTADAVGARTIHELGPGFDGTAFVATGANYPDALAAAPLAAGLHWPLFLTRSTGIAASTTSAMSGVDEVLILGGTAVVPPAIETALNAAYGDANVTRLAGADRYATAVAVATYGVNNGLAWDGLAIATGQKFPDALAGGVLQGRDGSVMLLTKTDSLEPPVSGVLTAHKAEINEVRYLGGVNAVSQAVRDAVAAILQ